MKKALKELIENSPELKGERLFTKLMFISNGVYKGFWGKNDYNNIIILGLEYESNDWYRITGINQQCDVFFIYKCTMSFNLDIPKQYGIPSMWFDKPVKIKNDLQLSGVTGEIEGGI